MAGVVEFVQSSRLGRCVGVDGCERRGGKLHFVISALEMGIPDGTTPAYHESIGKRPSEINSLKRTSKSP